MLYSDKNYSAEAKFVDQIIKCYVPGAKNILEFGCGTGIHAEKLEGLGYIVHGIDISKEMIEYAKETHVDSIAFKQGTLSFEHCDIKKFITSNKYDLVVSLFHVMSYLTSNDELLSAFKTARNCLSEGGIFFFDCWYGPAVLNQKPSERMKKVEEKDIEVFRYAKPYMDYNNNTVKVEYRILGIDNKLATIEEFIEEHKVRYFFQPELELMSKLNGFTLISTGEWITKAIPSENTWCVYYVFKAI